MGQPAARITDMHVCPMITPGVPPIPHVGGPIMGPGVPNVLIGKMPAVVMGDMCVCVGPPDSIIKGSTGVMIGGRPAARMGDLTVHGGSIVFGFPTVLIGEVGASAPPAITITPVAVMVAPVVIPPIVFQNMSPESAEILDQTASMQNAADNGYPFCEVCGQGNSSSDNAAPESLPNEPEEEPTPEEPQLLKCYFIDTQDRLADIVNIGDIIKLVIESINMVGEEITVDLNDNGHNYKYNGELLFEDNITLTLESDFHTVELEVVEEPCLKRIYFMDEAEETIIENLMVGENVVLVVESVNLIGEAIDIDLESKSVDYEYNGALLEEDTLKQYTINADSEKIPLKILASANANNNGEEVEPEPQILQIYFTDENGYEIGETIRGREVILVIETLNMIGQTVDINMDDKDADYEYNGVVLPNDTLAGYLIQNDVEKVRLKVLAQAD